jgi:hypothetical protein
METQIFSLLLFFSCGLLIWKAGRSALLGWARLERLHRLTEEERWEIEHHPTQEKEELTELYRAKGFDGKLLEEVVDVLMADDNRLLGVMLEEELGLTLEVYDHPLKQAAGAAAGVTVVAVTLLLLFWFFPLYGIPAGATLMLAIFSTLAATKERNRALPALIWNFALPHCLQGSFIANKGPSLTRFCRSEESIGPFLTAFAQMG